MLKTGPLTYEIQWITLNLLKEGVKRALKTAGLNGFPEYCQHIIFSI